MATVVLTTVGSLVGGPIGAAVGAVIGSQIDRRLLAPAPKGRQGPRLGDLTVQTSSYGSAIPRLFGTMRVAGTVIWATDLREDVHRSGGGKGGAKTTDYSYSASFAVALSARPIRRVGRIWADGKLLRGAAGDWKSETGFRLYTGDEAQAPDPLIASAEGIASTPAHRGLAYALFDTLQLADFGNRIPSLTFEVEADETAVPVAAIAAELTGGALAGEGGPAIGGFAASGDSVRGALEALAQAYPMPLADDGMLLRIGATGAAAAGAAAIDVAALGASIKDGGEPRRGHARQAAGQLPDEIALGYYEPARDYQAGLQRARRDGIGQRAERIDLAAAIEADAAKGLAEAALARRWSERDQLTVTLPWRQMEIAAGTRVSLDGETWRVARRKLERMAVELQLVRDRAMPLAISGAAPGRATGATDETAGATALMLVDLPALDGTLAEAPRVYLAAAGTGAGWRRADVSLSFDDGASWQAAGRTAASAVMGSALGALAAGSGALFDRRAALDLALLNDGMALSPATEAQLIDGTNLALVGDELLQFGTAVQIGPARWRIGDLLRGRLGSDWAIPGHAAGEPFLLLDPATLLVLDVPPARVGTVLRVSGAGPAEQGVPASDAIIVVGRALRPPAPVALRAMRRGDGAIVLGWIRRSRGGWTWLDGIDAPLSEDRECYRLSLRGAGGLERQVDLDLPAFVYAPADQATDGWAGTGTLAVELVQVGTHAPSAPPARASWTF